MKMDVIEMKCVSDGCFYLSHSFHFSRDVDNDPDTSLQYISVVLCPS